MHNAGFLEYKKMVFVLILLLIIIILFSPFLSFFSPTTKTIVLAYECVSGFPASFIYNVILFFSEITLTQCVTMDKTDEPFIVSLHQQNGKKKYESTGV